MIDSVQYRTQIRHSKFQKNKYFGNEQKEHESIEFATLRLSFRSLFNIYELGSNLDDTKKIVPLIGIDIFYLFSVNSK